MAYLLITGATGMLGHYLLRDSLLAGRPTAVLVRGSRIQSARQRIDLIVSAWELSLGKSLPRPVVLEGDIHQAGLGLAHGDTEWIRQHCDALLNSAASVKFYTEAPEHQQDVEPYLSNVIGTRNVLDFCRDTGISHFHHISTAYVCGQQSETAYEQIPAGVRFGNDYEASKAESESLVLQADHLLTKTILRPSIIVGDSKTGYTSAFHTIYTALRVASMLGQRPSHPASADADAASIDAERLLAAVGMHGGETKNLVPVDWVSSCINAIVGNSDLHGRIYHITNPSPTPVQAIAESMRAAIADHPPGRNRLEGRLPVEVTSAEDFRWMMDAYRAYFCSDPQFDSRHLQQHLPHLPCPRLDPDGLVRLWKYALDVDFSSRLPAGLEEKAHDIETLLSKALRPWVGAPFGHADFKATLQVEGSSGGSWEIGFNKTGDGLLPAMYRPGDKASKTNMVIIIHDDDLIKMLGSTLSIDDLLYSGALFIHSPELTSVQLQSLAERLFRTLRWNQPGLPGHVSR